MAPVPKKRMSRARSDRRRNSPARRGPSIPNLTPCASCKKLRESHIACPHCGFYKTA
ncbi:50S ribosomal protein L32 [Patescibacteria group bacterium]|nr:50S ribosomal protein L32 [Patescibacteria group bacterium]